MPGVKLEPGVLWVDSAAVLDAVSATVAREAGFVAAWAAPYGPTWECRGLHLGLRGVGAFRVVTLEVVPISADAVAVVVKDVEDFQRALEGAILAIATVQRNEYAVKNFQIVQWPFGRIKRVSVHALSPQGGQHRTASPLRHLHADSY